MVNIDELKYYVESYFGYSGKDTDDIAQSILDKYDKNRIRYALDNDMDLYDLDRWESISRLNKTHNLVELLKADGFEFTKNEIDKYLEVGKDFVLNMVDPLYEEDYEIMELIY